MMRELVIHMNQTMQVFIKVVERQSFSRTAEELLMTQPAVSQHIRTLENEVGARLLERTNKYVRLTKAGEIVYHHAKEMIGLHTRMQTLVDDLVKHASGPLSIGASFTFGEYLLPHIIAKMKVHHPHIQPTITIGNTREIAHYVNSHQLDIGIIEGHYMKENHLQVDHFAEDHMIVVAPPDHPLLNQAQPIKLSALVKDRWVLREVGSGTREAADDIFKQHKLSPEAIMTFGSTQAIKEAIEAGLGISLLSKWAIQKELRNGDICMIDVADLPYNRNFSIVTATQFLTKAQQIFIELLHNSKEITEVNFK